MKKITFSFDDGVTQDARLIELMNRYGLKGTFNLNSGLLGREDYIVRQGRKISHKKVRVEEVKCLYAGHEVAVHTLTHPDLTIMTDDEIVRQTEQDRKALSALVGYEVIGMSYTGGGKNYSERVVERIRTSTGIRYARTIEHSYDFRKNSDLLQVQPTARCSDFETLLPLAESFLSRQTDESALLYIWGHSFDFDVDESWNVLEDFFSMIAHKDDIWYCTNREALL